MPACHPTASKTKDKTALPKKTVRSISREKSQEFGFVKVGSLPLEARLPTLARWVACARENAVDALGAAGVGGVDRGPEGPTRLPVTGGLYRGDGAAGPTMFAAGAAGGAGCGGGGGLDRSP